MPIQIKITSAPRAHLAGERRDYVRSLEQLRASDRPVAGGKGANLGELHSAHIPVPAGFVITAEAYRDAMATDVVHTKLVELVDTTHDVQARTRIADELCALVRERGISDALRSAIRRAYHELGDSPRVAVRSSATHEDLDSSAGVNLTFTNVRGEEALLDAVIACWRRLWELPAVSPRPRTRRDTDAPAPPTQPAIAVVVQHMIDSEKAGLAFSSNTTSADRPVVMIQAAYGLGVVVVSGQVHGDLYAVDKTTLRLVEASIGQKPHKIVAGESGDLGVALDAEQRTRRVLEDHDLSELASVAVQIERHFGAPQEIEWAIFEGTTYVLRTRAISAHPLLPQPKHAAAPATSGVTLAEGSDP